MRNRPKARQRIVALALLLAPPTVLGLLRLLDLLDVATATSTLLGCGVAAMGGLLSGTVAEHLLHRGRGGSQYLIGVIAITTVSVITIGYIYLVHMHSPMATIGTTQRTLQQLLIFVQFLSAQGAGILFLIPGAGPHLTQG